MVWACSVDSTRTLSPVWAVGYFPYTMSPWKKETQKTIAQNPLIMSQISCQGRAGTQMTVAGVGHKAWHSLFSPLCPSGKKLNIIPLLFNVILEYASFLSSNCISKLHWHPLPHHSMALSLQQRERQAYVWNRDTNVSKLIPYGVVGYFAFVWVWSLSTTN